MSQNIPFLSGLERLTSVDAGQPDTLEPTIPRAFIGIFVVGNSHGSGHRLRWSCKATPRESSDTSFPHHPPLNLERSRRPHCRIGQ
jgi:hypothetical protein